jgi:hypothetical protein
MVPHGPGLGFLSFSTTKQLQYLLHLESDVFSHCYGTEHNDRTRYKEEKSYQDLKFSQQCCWGFESLEMWHCVVGSWHFKGTEGIHLHKSIRPPAISAQVFLGFPLSKSKCWDGSQHSQLLLHASHVALPTSISWILVSYLCTCIITTATGQQPICS